MNPFGYHLSNVILHSLNALLFCLLCAKLLASADKAPAAGKETALYISAGFAALFFALHPLRVESVAWVTERRDVLSGFFYLLALLWYLPGRGGGEEPYSRFRLLLSPAAYLLSLLSKSIVMTLPLVLLALDIYPLKRLSPDPRRWAAPEYRNIWLEKIPFVVLAAIFVALAYLSADRSGVIISTQQYGFAARAMQALYAAGFYLWKLLVPLDLSPLYRLPPGFGFSTWQFISAASAVTGITAAVIALRRRWPAGALVWFFYLVTLTPVLGIVKGGPQAVADRYTYLSCLGFAVLAGAGLRAGLRAPAKQLRLASSLLACLVISGLALLTWRQEKVWLDTESLWTHAVRVGPESDFARGLLGEVMDKQGRLDEAAEQYREALRLNPRLWKAHNNLGADLAAMGKVEEAIPHYREAIAMNPDYVEAHNNLGSALDRQGKREEAAGHFREALRLSPGFYRAHNNWAISLTAQGKLDQASLHYREALRIAPDCADAHNNLAGILARQGRLAEAGDHCLEALKFSPDFAQAHHNLSLILAMQGKREEALRHHLRALELAPKISAGPRPDKSR
jgi:tetratricopeptide (TPR) repeat protein